MSGSDLLLAKIADGVVLVESTFHTSCGSSIRLSRNGGQLLVAEENRRGCHVLFVDSRDLSQLPGRKKRLIARRKTGNLEGLLVCGKMIILLWQEERSLTMYCNLIATNDGVATTKFCLERKRFVCLLDGPDRGGFLVETIACDGARDLTTLSIVRHPRDLPYLWRLQDIRLFQKHLEVEEPAYFDL